VATAGLAILQITCKALGGNTLAKQNGTRIIVQLISSAATNDDESFLPALTSSMLIIETVATTAEGREALSKQVSEQSERTFWKTSILAMKCAKWLQTKWLHQLLS